MSIHIPYTPPPADERFYQRLAKGIEREKTTAHVCEKMKKITNVFSVFVGIAGFAGLFVAAGLAAAGVVGLVAIPIIFACTMFLCFATALVYDAFKGRIRLASNRIGVQDRELINKINVFRMVLQNPRFAPVHMLIPSDSEAVFYQRIGIISPDTRKQIKEINGLYFSKERYKRFNQRRRMQRVEAEWDEMRVRMQNDLPSNLMLRELLK